MIPAEFSGVRFFERSEFKKEEYLANGAEGSVWQVEHALNGKMAVKMFSENRLRRGVQEKLREIENIVKCNHHQNIIRFFGYVCENINGERHIIGYAMEHMADKSLREVIDNHSIAYGILEVVSWGGQASLALAWLHSEGIIHRDVKPDNMLLSDGRRTLKLCDFGCTRSKLDKSMTMGIGTLLYMAPELKIPVETAKYCNKCDIYSLGITLWEMSTRKNPFVEAETSRLPLDLILDTDLRNIIQHCISDDPIHRPTMQDVGDRLKVIESSAIRSISSNAEHPADPHSVCVISPINSTSQTRSMEAPLSSKNVTPSRGKFLNHYIQQLSLANPNVSTEVNIRKNRPIPTSTPTVPKLRSQVGWDLNNFCQVIEHVAVDSPVLADRMRRENKTIENWNQKELESEAMVTARVAMRKFNFSSMLNVQIRSASGVKEQELQSPKIPEKNVRILSLPVKTGGVRSMLFNPANEVLVSVYSNMEIVRFWDLPGSQDSARKDDDFRRNVQSLETYVDDDTFIEILFLAWNSLGTMPATAATDGKLRIYSASGELQHTVAVHLPKDEWMRCLAWSPDDKYIAVGSPDLTVVVWDVNEDKIVHSYCFHFGKVTKISWMSDTMFASRGEDNTIRICQVGRDTVVRTFHGEGRIFGLACVDIYSKLLITYSNCDPQIQVFSITQEAPMFELHTKSKSILSIAFSQPLKILAW